MSKATFVMSNIMPQAGSVNRGRWERLEAYCRDLVQKQGKVLYIIAGPAGKGGTGEEGKADFIGTDRKIQVPAFCWKVIMVLYDEPGDDLSKVDANTRLIAVIMPNEDTPGQDWSQFRRSVREVEQLTGFNFFDKVDPAIIGPLKAKVDQVPISHL